MSDREEELAEFMPPLDIAPCENCSAYLQGVLQFIANLDKNRAGAKNYIESIINYINQQIEEIKGDV